MINHPMYCHCRLSRNRIACKPYTAAIMPIEMYGMAAWPVENRDDQVDQVDGGGGQDHSTEQINEDNESHRKTSRNPQSSGMSTSSAKLWTVEFDPSSTLRKQDAKLFGSARQSLGVWTNLVRKAGKFLSTSVVKYRSSPSGASSSCAACRLGSPSSRQ